MFGASSPCWRVEQGSSSNVVTTGNNFVLSGPLQYLFFLIQSVTNPFYHFFRISFNNVISIGESVSLNFCTKSPTTGKLTEYDSQIICYGGDTSTGGATTGTNGQGIMVLNARRIGVNKLNPTTVLDVNGDINCTNLNVYNGNITSGIPINMEYIMSNGIESKNKYNLIVGNNLVPFFKINNTSAKFNNFIIVDNSADQNDSTTVSYNYITTRTLNTTDVNTTSVYATSKVDAGYMLSLIHI